MLGKCCHGSENGTSITNCRSLHFGSEDETALSLMAVEVMRLELYDQIHTFAITLLTGAILGIIFDFYRVTRGMLPFRGSIMTTVMDFMYWVIATAVVIIALLFCNWLELRMYVFIGLIGGAATYYRWISRYVLGGIVRLYAVTGKLIGYLYQVVCFTIIKPVSCLLRLMLFPLMKSRQSVSKSWNRIKQWMDVKKKPSQ